MQNTQIVNLWSYKGKTIYIFCHNIYQTNLILQSLTDGDESFSITEAVQALGKIIFCQWIDFIWAHGKNKDW